MLQRQAKYLLDLFGLQAAVLFHVRQKQSHRGHLIEQNFRARQRLGNRLVEHLAVVPDTNGILQSCQRIELSLQLLGADLEKQFGAVSQNLGGDAQGVVGRRGRAQE